MTKGHGGGRRDVAHSPGGSTEVFPFHRCSPSSLCCFSLPLPPPQVSVTDHKVQEFRASNNKERRYSERRPKRGQERNQSQARHTLLHHPRTPTTRPRFNRFTRARWRASKGAASATTMWKAAAPSLNLLICIRLSLTGSRGQGSPPARPPHRPGPSCSSDCEPHQCGCAPDRRTLLPSSGRGDT